MTSNKQSGFTLIELAIVIGIGATIIGASAMMARPYISSSKLTTTKIKEENISKVLSSYAATYGRLPCPADPNAPDLLFGTPRNSGPNGTDVGSNGCGGGGRADYAGIIPFRALNLGEEQAKDEYGNFFTYAVNPALTKFNPATPTALSTQDACTSTTWKDQSGLKNPTKAAVCCAIPDKVNGELVISDSVNAPLVSQTADKYNKHVDGVPALAPTTKEVEVTIMPDGDHMEGLDNRFHENGSCNKQEDSNQRCYFGGDPAIPGERPFRAPQDNEVLVGRFHENGYKGDTAHQYALLKAVDKNGKKVQGTFSIPDAAYEPWFPEGNQDSDPGATGGNPYVRRPNTVLIGRSHQDDARGFTRYYTGTIHFNGQALEVDQGSLIQSQPIPESTPHTYAPDPGYFIIERIHGHDGCNGSPIDGGCGGENGSTYYIEGKLKKITVTVPVDAYGGTDPDDQEFIKQTSVPIDRSTAFIVVSHGKNGDGSFQRNAGLRISTAPVNAIERRNYAGNLSFVNTAYSTADNDTYFDDIVTFRTTDQIFSTTNGGSCMRP